MNNIDIVTVNFEGVEDVVSLIKSVKSNFEGLNLVVIDNNSSQNIYNQLVLQLNEEFNNKKFNFNQLIYLEHSNGKFRTISKATNSKNENNNLIIIRNDSNCGFSCANNIGIEYLIHNSSNEFYWLLNNDLILNNDTLDNLNIELISLDSSVGIIGTKMLYLKNNHKTNIVLSFGGRKKSRLVNLGKVDGKGLKNNNDSSYELNGYVNGGSMIVKKDLYLKIGELPNEYFLDLEDVEYSLRAMKNKYKLYYLNKVIVYHKEGGTFNIAEKRSIKSFFRRYYAFRNEILIVNNYFNSIEKLMYYIILLPLKFIFFILRIIYFNDTHKIKRIKLIVKAILDGFLKRTGKTIDPKKWINQFRNYNEK